MEMNIIYKAMGLCIAGTVVSNTVGEAYPKSKQFIDIAFAIVGTVWSLSWIIEYINKIQIMIEQMVNTLCF